MSAPRGELDITVYGRRAVLEALECPTVEVAHVAFSGDVPGDIRRAIAQACERLGIEPQRLSPADIARLSGDPRNDQGVAALIRLGTVTEPGAFLQSLTGRRAAEPARLIALDGVTNPQNVGMIIRSSLAAGMAAMLWPTVGSPWVSGLVIKSSAATVYRCPIVRCQSLVEGLYEFKAAGFTLVGLDASSGVVESIFDHRPAHRAVYIVGSEAQGISAEVGALLDARVAIPMAGGVESLNAAVAAALVCFLVSDGAAKRRSDAE